VDLIDHNQQTPLYLAITEGHYPLAKMLLEARADVENRLKYDNTPLICAALKGNEAIINLLFSYGANPNSDRPALKQAAASGKAATVHLLLDAGAKIDGVDEENQTALFDANKNQDHAIIKQLVNAGAEIDFLDVKGNTPFMSIAHSGSYGKYGSRFLPCDSFSASVLASIG
jgi:ankyrin repeat protein